MREIEPLPTCRNELISALKLWIIPLVGRKLKTAFAPFDPTNRFLKDQNSNSCLDTNGDLRGG